MLTVRGLNHYYGGSHTLRGIDLHIPRGSCTAVLGRNGVGKTTTLRTISGLHVQMPERDLQVLSQPVHTGLDQSDEPTIPGTTPRHLEGIR